MKYRSTRGGARGLGFENVVMQGLADDGGLFVPEEVPRLTPAELESLKNAPYQAVAFAVMRKFISTAEMGDAELRAIIDRSYSTFRHPSVVPDISLDSLHSSLHLLELFHGPTFAFKDVALQFLGNLFEVFLKRRKSRMTILGATSGDTGSAAIYGVRGKKNIECVILYPHQRTSPTQELQMATVPDENIHCVAVKGNFDDCQGIVKKLFGTNLKRDLSLGAVNSINWARILAQIVYYVFASVRHSKGTTVDFVVPTGNFGDILAGYYARLMGAPVGSLVIASNSNDILPRFFESGEYRIKGAVRSTLSPSMDIQISSNFERVLFDLFSRDPARLAGKMKDLNTKGGFAVSKDELDSARKIFTAHSVSEEETKGTILEVFQKTGGQEVVCPHTAVGICVALRHIRSGAAEGRPVVALATAHWGKFVDFLRPAMQDKALHSAMEKMPTQLASLSGLPLRRTIVPNSPDSIRDILHAAYRRSPSKL
eukprot:Hpha_TRINITY_DN16820_c6_g5::TRINITY_DN16820_c6_g5_i1::g.151477::m.151477/K01733/thrC; threonine synthase